MRSFWARFPIDGGFQFVRGAFVFGCDGSDGAVDDFCNFFVFVSPHGVENDNPLLFRVQYAFHDRHERVFCFKSVVGGRRVFPESRFLFYGFRSPFFII